MTSSPIDIIPQEESAQGPEEYAARILSQYLATLGSAGISGDRAVHLRIDSCLAPQEFLAEWRPVCDPKELFDPSFSWSVEKGTIERKLDVKIGNLPLGAISAGDGEGLIYGVREFIERCQVRSALPLRPFSIRSRPALKLRMACLQVMKRGSYTFAITPAEFPWFYDKAWWTRYADFLAANGFNAVALWNYHPFVYFSRIPGYPEAREMDDDALEENASMLRWICSLLKMRGIRPVFHFYNVYVPESVKRAHGLTGLHNCFTPEQEAGLYGYLRVAIRAFAEEFPEVGFLACVGEGVPGGKAERFARQVIIEALRETSHKPLFILRQWASLSAARVAEEIVGTYPNLWLMMKHNAEHIASTLPDARLRRWANLGVPLIANFHMLSEMAPFRWAPPSFIRETCLTWQAMGVQGVHVYPHWSWRIPRTGDKDLAHEEIERDWLYHEAWGRYAFDPVRDADEEHRHWRRRFQEKGCDRAESAALVSAYEKSARVLPRLQQHLWIHYDNHSVLAAGFTLGQLRLARSMHGMKIIETDRLGDLFPLRLQIKGEPPDDGDYPFAEAADLSGREINEAIVPLQGWAAAKPTDSEAFRLLADLRGQRHTVEFLRRKAEAASLIYQGGQRNDLPLLRSGRALLEESVRIYRECADWMEKWTVGISDVGPLFPIFAYKHEALPYTWSDCLPYFERELHNIQTAISILERSEPWSICWHDGLFRERSVEALEKAVTSQGLWIRGDLDAFEWPWMEDLLREVVFLPGTSWGGELGVCGNIPALREWLHRGGQVTFYTSRIWRDHLLAELLQTSLGKLGVQSREVNGQIHTGIEGDPDLWQWSEKLGSLGIQGTRKVGRGEIVLRPLPAMA